MTSKSESVSLQTLNNACKDADHIRNVCILAHVDHGKTTIADSLLASNGLISHLMAGKIRYMDSREDEQIRGITMKSSAISLKHHIFDGDMQGDYVVNFVDSPGHVDFATEVNAVVRICDGAVIVIDAVEGVRAQTISMIDQSIKEKLQLIIVINKLDRYITDLHLNTDEAYIKICQIIETLNATIASRINETSIDESINDMSTPRMNDLIVEEEQSSYVNKNDVADDNDDNHIDPRKTNVIFSSAIGSWAFSIQQFAKFYAKKFNLRVDALTKKLWGDFYIDKKTKKFKRCARAKGNKPLFVTLILDPIWSLFQSLTDRNASDVEKKCASLKIKYPSKITEEPDLRDRIMRIFHQWIPLSSILLDAIVLNVNGPSKISNARINLLMSGGLSHEYSEAVSHLSQGSQDVWKAIQKCDHDQSADIVAYVSKFIAVNKSNVISSRQVNESFQRINQDAHDEKRQQLIRRLRQQENERVEHSILETIQELNINNAQMSSHDENHQLNSSSMLLLGFARLYSGCIHPGQSLYMLWPRYNPSIVDESTTELETNRKFDHATKIHVKQVYLMMGRDFYPVPHVYAGNIFAFEIVESIKIKAKSVTLSSTLLCPPLTAKHANQNSQLIHVALETKNPTDMNALRSGLHSLRDSDPAVEIKHLTTGELVLFVSGEVHLERCLKDLRECFCFVDFNVSDPMVSFKETFVNANPDKMWSYSPNADIKSVLPTIDDNSTKLDATTVTDRISVSIMPLPQSVIDLLNDNSQSLFSPGPELRNKLAEKLAEHCAKKSKQYINTFLDSILSFGSSSPGLSNVSSNILVSRDPVLNQYFRSVWHSNRIRSTNIKQSFVAGIPPSMMDDGTTTNMTFDCHDELQNTSRSMLTKILEALVHGFQLSLHRGPLCSEPIVGVCVLIDWIDDIFDLSKSSYSATFDVVSTRSSSISLSCNDEDVSTFTNTYDFTVKQEFGQLISLMKDTCCRAFDNWPFKRLVHAMYRCEIECPYDTVGKLFPIIGRRQGKIIAEEIAGIDRIIIVALIPIVESFGFVSEVWAETSGSAMPQLMFDRWEILDEDPQYHNLQETTQISPYNFRLATVGGASCSSVTNNNYICDEEDESSLLSSKNRAQRYVNAVRKRKGLKIKEITVKFAEKQRTLGKNK